MTQLSDFPPDVQAAAKAAICSHGFPGGDLPTGVMEQDIEAIIARAVTAERQRCASIARGFPHNRDWVPGSLYDAIRSEVSAAILTPTPGA